MTTLTINIDRNHTDSNGVAILPDTLISEEEIAWIWDHYFAFVLNKLDEEAADNLLSQSIRWATKLTQNLTTPYSTLKEQGYLVMGTPANFDLLTMIEMNIYIEISALPNALPALHIYVPDSATNYQLTQTTFTLANFFLANYPHFYKELPLHIMAMKKYYKENNPFADELSISEAPLFATQIAMQFYQQRGQR